MANAKGLIATGPPATPSFVFILRCVALVLSVACFIAGCYNVSLIRRITTFNFSTDAPGGLTIFTCIWTWIVLGLDIAFGLKLHKFYYRIGFFIGYILTIIFWLSTWALAAAAAGDTLDCGDTVCTQYGGSAAAIAALGAILWVLLIVIFVFWVLASLRDGPATATANTTELGAVKTEGVPPNGAGAGVDGAPQQYPPQGYAPEQQGAYPPQGYPEQKGTPGPYQQSPYAAPGSPDPHQGYGQQQNNTPYPEQPVGYPQEPHQHQSPPQQYPQQGQPGVPYPQ
jgi:hypothetical protein